MTPFYIPADTWVAVATAVTSATVLPINTGVTYAFEVLPTGAAAPTNGDTADYHDVARHGLLVNQAAAVDVYIAVTQKGVAGRVKVY